VVPQAGRRREGRALNPVEAKALLNVAIASALGCGDRGADLGTAPWEVSGLTCEAVDYTAAVSLSTGPSPG
jgi:hypothetical protein